MTLSERIKKFRLAYALTQEQVAEALGIERTTYTYYENGKHEPSITRVKELAKLFNTDIATLLGDEYVPENGFVVADELNAYNENFDTFTKLKKDEAMLLLYYRRLDSGKQAKLLKSIKEKYSK